MRNILELSVVASLLAVWPAAAFAGYASLSDGEHFVYNTEQAILTAPFKTPDKPETLFELSRMRGDVPSVLSAFTFSPDERRVLLEDESGGFYLYRVEANRCSPLSYDGETRYPLFSPNGKMVAFTRGTDIWIARLEYETEFAVTTDGATAGALNAVRTPGEAEAFGAECLMAWTADSRHLVYAKGQELYMYSVQYKWNKPIALPAGCDYVTAIVPAATPDKWAAVCLNREQDQLQVALVDASTLIAKVIYTSKENRYVSPAVFRGWLPSPSLDAQFALSQKDGYTHVYQYNMLGREVKRLTSGEYDVTALLGYDASSGTLYYISSEPGGGETGLYGVNVKSGKRVTLSERRPRQMGCVSSTWRYFLTDGTVTDSRGKTLVKGEVAEKRPSGWQAVEQEGFDGWTMCLSARPSRLVMLAGEGSNGNPEAYAYLAKQGCLVASFRVHGTAGRGEEFEKSVYRRFCSVQAADYARLASGLASRYGIASSDVYIMGSGLNAAVALTAASLPDTPFAGCIATAPVTDLRAYNHLLVERLMQSEGANAGYRSESPLGQVDSLRARIMLVQAVDMENTASVGALWPYLARLQSAGVLYDLLLCPGKCPCTVNDTSDPYVRKAVLHFMEND